VSKSQITNRFLGGPVPIDFKPGAFRQALATALAIGALFAPSAALAQFFPGFGYGYRHGNYGFGNGGYAPNGGYYVAPRPRFSRPAEEPEERHAQRHSRRKSEEAKTAATRVASPKTSGPLIVAVSIGSQRVTVYDNGVQVASAPVSTGMKGHPTPLGAFSIIQKEKWHESNLYSNAPMPFMERITWSGVALHAGVLPGYPASHGCIRMPHEFAVRLYGMTRLGARVIVTRDDTSPVEITHPQLALLAPKPLESLSPASVPPGSQEKRLEERTPGVGEATPPSGATGDGSPISPGSGASAEESAGSKDPELGLRSSGQALLHPAIAGLSVQETTVPPLAGAKLLSPDQSPFKIAEPAAAKPVERPLRPGPISLFVSRKEGKLFVRKGFEPVFDMPVTIAHPEVPLGTHVFTAAPVTERAGSLRWLAVSIPNGGAAAAEPQPIRHKSRRQQAEPAPPPVAVPLAADALNRIELPPEALERIAPLMGVGASLVIADQGLGPETGKETDFIVLTR
jgi:hypothetical protein